MSAYRRKYGHLPDQRLSDLGMVPSVETQLVEAVAALMALDLAVEDRMEHDDEYDPIVCRVLAATKGALAVYLPLLLGD